MRISIDWLKEFVSIKEDPADLADMLSMLGLEAEPVHDFSVLTGVVIGKVATAKKHPNADRLKLCTVNDGTTTVKCGVWRTQCSGWTNGCLCPGRGRITWRV